MRPTVLLIYDGECRFCRWGIDWIRRFDVHNALRFCPFGQPVAEAELARVPSDRRYQSMHAVVRRRLFSGTDAARVVLQQLPLGGVSALLGLHRFYPLIARHRAVLGRLSPDRPAPSSCGDETPARDSATA